MELRLRSATADEIEPWLSRLAADYAAEIAGAGSLPPDEARQKADNDLRAQLRTAPAS